MSHLAAHDWDRIGQPPAPGRDYVVSVLERDILDVAKALVEADDFDEEADQLDDEANDRRRDGDKKRDSVKDRLDAIRKDNPKLAAAIEDNPRDYDSLDAARKAAA